MRYKKMHYFRDFRYRWRDPCFLDFSVYDQVVNSPLTYEFDVLTPRLKQAFELHFMETKKLILNAWSGRSFTIELLAADLLDMHNELKGAVEQQLHSTAGCFRPEAYKRAPLGDILRQGVEHAAIYVAREPNAYGRWSWKLRAHTLPSAPEPHLWAEMRVDFRLPAERFTALVRSHIRKVPRKYKIDEQAWLDSFARLEPWTVQHLKLNSPNASWSRQVPVVFVFGPDDDALAGTSLMRNEIHSVSKSGDVLAIVAKEEHRDHPKKFFLKAKPGHIDHIENKLMTGQQSEFRAGEDILGMAVFYPETRADEDIKPPYEQGRLVGHVDPFAGRVGDLHAWRFPVKDLESLFVPYGLELAPTEITLSGLSTYEVFKSGTVARDVSIPQSGTLCFEPAEHQAVGVWKRDMSGTLSVPVYRKPGWNNTLSIWRGRARVNPSRPAATLIQFIAVHPSKSQVNIRLVTVEYSGFAERSLTEPKEIESFLGENWQDAGYLLMHLNASRKMQRLALG